MSEESITSLGSAGSRSLSERIRRGFERFLGRKTKRKDVSEVAEKVEKLGEIPTELRERARAEIQNYVADNEALFERASRFEERAERLQSSDGTTSESALNRAERARSEIRTGLSDLRDSFASSEGEEGERAFDAELENLHPNFVQNPETRDDSGEST